MAAEEIEAQEPDDDQTEAIRNMRDRIKDQNRQLEDQTKELETLRVQARRAAFLESGFDPDSGPGKLIAQTYEGELTPEAITEYAESFGFSPERDRARQRQNIEDQAAAVAETATAGEPPPLDVEEQADKALEEGDVATSLALKMRAFLGKQSPTQGG